ncbi:hypothetical protein DPX39_020010600 [Trypanosoma brucei equiperdum]|uniref:Uncharacterized protein n=1 Tax=Trypanosoma brucei equiperdum TaxID=630700 RepID=A0A3L6LBY3_9TRYP|nr:hypothetical protein DPX39_020010600 [Trypanosoma brucei equiperdum]
MLESDTQFPSATDIKTVASLTEVDGQVITFAQLRANRLKAHKLLDNVEELLRIAEEIKWAFMWVSTS